MATATEEKGKALAQLQLRLIVDKRKSRVVYAECDRFMADVFISFLATPVGALVRLTGKDSGLGCMDSLYQSVEDMDACYFETPECRELLLRPRSACGFPYQRLKIGINADADQRFPYACPSDKCPKYSLFPGAKCECGRDMTSRMPMDFPPPLGSDVVFIRNDLDSFVVTDGLFIAPSSDALKRNLCNLAGVDSTCGLEEQIVLVDNDQIVELMKLSILSNTPLTDTFLPSDFVVKPICWPLEFLQQHFVKTENLCLRIINKLGKDLLKMITPTLGRKKMTITLFHNEKRVLFIRAEKEFIDLLFSFLTFPFGSIVTAVGGRSSLGCLDNLHQVVRRFISDRHFYAPKLLPDGYGNYILNPSIAHHHNCHNGLLKIGLRPIPIYCCKCKTCSINGIDIFCKDSQHTHSKWKPINPKLKGKPMTKRGGGYMRGPETFLITDGLVVKPICGFTENSFATGLEAKSVVVGQNEAVKLLMASLISKDPLSVFFKDDVDQ